MTDSVGEVVDHHHQPQHQSFLIIHNVSKKNNIGMIVRSAVAFGVSEICVIGSRDVNTFGNHGSSDFMKFSCYQTLAECTRALKERGFRVVGIEICDNARPVQSLPFQGSTAFMMGNEASGLMPKQIAECDDFVYIPQIGAGTASLNVNVATSIVLHHFSVWAGYPERQRQGFKFVVGERPVKHTKGGVIPLSEEEQRQLKECRRAAMTNDWADGEMGLNMMEQEGEDDGADDAEREREIKVVKVRNLLKEAMQMAKLEGISKDELKKMIDQEE